VGEKLRKFLKHLRKYPGDLQALAVSDGAKLRPNYRPNLEKARLRALGGAFGREEKDGR